MTAVDSSRASDKVLKDLLASVLNVLGETLGSLVAQQVRLKPRDMISGDPATLARTLEGQSAVVRGAMDKAYAGRMVRVVMDARDATSLACHLMMTPDEVIRQRRNAGTLEGEDVETFGEVANVLCSGIDQVLRSSVKGTVGVRLQDHGLLTGPADQDNLLGDQPLVGMRFELRVASYPETVGLLLLDLATAEAFNGGPLETHEVNGEAPTAGAETRSAGSSSKQPGSPAKASTATDRVAPEQKADELEAIPEAPVRARMAAFLIDHDAVPIVRRSCRRVGLEFDRRARTEIPNPAAHKDQVLLIELAPGEDRRFDWCRRIKQYDPGIKVVLLLHYPSRARVLQGFMAKADAIVGWPATESLLSQKLLPLMPPPPEM